MAGETDWQSKVVQKIKAEGGHARKLSSSFAVGVLDLMVVHPSLKTMFIEAKMLKDVGDAFNRRMDYTEKQKEEASNIRKAGGIAAGLAIIYKKPTEVYLTLVPVPPERQHFNVTHHMLDKENGRWKKTGWSLTEFLSEQLQTRWTWIMSGGVK